jgi:hypothetical protein
MALPRAGPADRNAIEDVSETLDDRAAFVDLIKEIENVTATRAPWTRAQLVSAVDKWIRSTYAERERDSAFPTIHSLATRIGPSNFVRLLIAKGLERAILAEEEAMEDERLTVRYSLAVPLLRSTSSL